MSARRPAVAGQFYPGSESEIKRMISELIDEGARKQKVIAAMGPHAGWVFSGRGAGMLYSRIEIPKKVVVLCPNHRGMGANMAVMSEGQWELPTGPVPLAEDLVKRLLEKCPRMEEDDRAHAAEHSLEVHLPFIQHFRPDFELVPVCISRLSYSESGRTGKGMAEAVEEQGEEVLVIASSDMTHFESAARAKEKDDMAIEKMLALDPEGLYNTVAKNRISMCGVIPATIMLSYAIARGAKEAELLDYRNSGDVTGDYAEVVAYASVIVK